MSEEISEEYLWRKVKIHTFLITPAAVFAGSLIGIWASREALPPLRTMIALLIGAYIGVSIIWLAMSEEKKIERERKAEMKRRRKSMIRRVIEFFAIIGGTYLILRLIANYM